MNYSVLGNRWPGLILTTVLIVLAGSGLEYVTYHHIHWFAWQRLNDMVSTIVVCGVVGLLYPLLLMATKVVTAHDLDAMPGAVQKLVSRIGRLFKRAKS